MANWFRKSGDEHSASRFFNGIGAIQAHLDQRSRIEDYVNGESQAKPDVPMYCHADCMLGKWLHGEGGDKCRDIGLLDSLSKSCEEFHEAAAQAVLLADMGRAEMAKAVLEDGRSFNAASVAYQQGLAKLHITVQR
jgi:hypothetical protein